MSSPLIDSLLAAVAANPADTVLRLHLVRLLLDAERPTEALEHCTAVLRSDPGNQEALDSLARATTMVTGAFQPPQKSEPTPPPAYAGDAFDWGAAEEQIGDIVAPAFVESAPGAFGDDVDVERPTVSLADGAGMQTVK